MEIVVLGCGPSTSVPSLRCLVSTELCRVCSEAQANPSSKNRRLNPSILVRNLATQKNILVDCGKTFREAALRVFPAVGVHQVHGVILTHGHADACLGMDDLREVQALGEQIDPVTKESMKVAQGPLLVHCSEATRQEMRGKFDYLLEKPVDPNAEPVTFRWIAQLRYQIFEPFTRFTAGGLSILPFPVVHGAGYLSNAFEFGAECGVRVVYISDVSELTPEASAFLNDASRPTIDVLIIDALNINKYHSTHMNLQAVLKEIRTIRPKRTLLTGMSHDFDYVEHTQMLRAMGEQEGLIIEMAYDGLRLPFAKSN